MSDVNPHIFNAGDIVQHFKRTMLDAKTLSENPTAYMYEIVGFATHTETKEPLVIYKALYTACDVAKGQLFARPYAMFMSVVDKKKYPEARQKYRFERSGI